MDNFKIHSDVNKYYVIPTAEYLQTVKDIPKPFDTNFLIYKLFGYSPREFLAYLHSIGATVMVQKSFPYISFYFHKYSSASNFLYELNNRVQEKRM